MMSLYGTKCIKRGKIRRGVVFINRGLEKTIGEPKFLKVGGQA